MMGVSLFFRKRNSLIFTGIFLTVCNGVSAESRRTNSSVIDKIRTDKFISILNDEVNPQMPPLFRGAVDALIDSTVAVIGSNSNFGSG